MNMPLVEECYWPDADDRHGSFSGSPDEFIAWVEPLLRRHTMTMHHLGSIIIDLDRVGAKAPAESYGVAYHSGEPVGHMRLNYAAGLRYIDRFERRENEWRFADRITAIEWVREWDADPQRIEAFGELLSKRDRTDPVSRAW
jgi:hypothetical protein